MLQNITNFFSLITGRMIKTKPANDDLLVLGTKDPRYGGGYKPTGITYENLKADIINEFPEEQGCGVKFGLNWATVGPKVSFKKTNYAIDYRDVIIPGDLELTRGNNQGLYNAAIEGGWNSSISPEDTVWNSEFTDASMYGWANLGDATNRTFDTFYRALNGSIGCEIVGKELVFLHLPTRRMWIIKFTEWTQGGNGGGFAYDRWEIFTSVVFYRPYREPLVVDKISDNLIIKRDNYAGIYNAAVESFYDNDCYTSPKGTRWNSIYTDPVNNGINNLTQVRNRKYGTWREAVDANPPAMVDDGYWLIMHDIADDQYYAVLFLYWGQGGNNGEMAYVRILIPQDCGIEFHDGTVMTTVSSSGAACCPTIDNDGNTIIDNVGDNLLAIGPGAKHLIADFSGMAIINDHSTGRIETWIAGSGDAVLVSYTAVGSGVPTSTMVMNGSGYEWANNDNLPGPFTIAVIKTRNGS